MSDRVIVRDDGSRVVVRTTGPTGDSAALVAPQAHATSHTIGGTDPIYDPFDLSDIAVEPFGMHVAQGALTLTSQRAILVPFRARATRPVTTLFSRSRATASTGLTLARMGVYSVNISTSIATLVARTATDTTLWGTGSTVYTRTLNTAGGYPASYDVTAGSWYAFALIAVGGAPGNVSCLASGMTYPSSFARARQAPAFLASSQADLATSYDLTALTSDVNAPHIGAY